MTMTEPDLAAALREFQDRQAIYDCMMRYCRGIDRFDAELAKSAYHPGAIDDHGAFVGPADQFIDYAIALHDRLQQRTQHHITNHIVELDGDAAHAESYYIFRSLNKEAPWHSIASGRYIDRLERRDGRWGIVARICTVEVRDQGWDPGGDQLDGPNQRTSRDRSDPSYTRPVTIDPSRFTQ
jgi:hypothetical protein